MGGCSMGSGLCKGVPCMRGVGYAYGRVLHA